MSKAVRSNVLGNAELQDDIFEIAFKEMKEQKQYCLEEHRYHKYIDGKLFHISTENLTQEKFILTMEDNLMVYQFDTNESSIFSTNQTFIEYVDSFIDWEGSVEGGQDWFGEYVIPKYR